MPNVESYIIHAYKKIPDDQLIGIAQILKTEKIVKDEAVKFSDKDENRWPHIYHFILDGSSKAIKCDDCGKVVTGNEVYYGPDADLCGFCHQKRYGDDNEGKFTFQESQKP